MASASLSVLKWSCRIPAGLNPSETYGGIIKKQRTASSDNDCPNLWYIYYYSNDGKGRWFGRGKSTDSNDVSTWSGKTVQYATYGGAACDSANGDVFTEYTAYSIANHTVTKVKKVDTPDASINASPTVTTVVSSNNGTITDGDIKYYVNGVGTATYNGYSSSKWKFVGWDGETSTASIHENAFGSDTSHIAYYSPKFTIKFNANYGSDGSGTGSMSNQNFVASISSNLTANAFVKTGAWNFIGWNTKADGTGTSYADEADGKDILTDVEGSAGDTVTLYAQWKYTAFDITVSKVDTAAGSTLPSGVGTLKLIDGNGNVVASSENSEVLSLVGGTAGIQYTLMCEMPDTSPSFLYTANGIYNSSTQTYSSTYVFTPSSGDILTKEYKFTAKSLYSVTHSSNVPSCTVDITDPSEPDSGGKYVAGRSITITGTVADGYRFSEANAYDSNNVLIGDGYKNIENNALTISQLGQDISVNCIFTKIDYDLDVEIDDASESAIESVTAEIGTQTGEAECTAQYGDTVVFTAILKDSFNGDFAGFYDGNTRHEGSVDPNNPKKYTYSHTVTGSLSLVAKAKASVSLSISYYNNAGITDPLQSCSVSVTSGGDIVLGDTATYQLTLGNLTSSSTDKWLFDAWYAVASPQSFTNPLDYDSSGTITPTENVSLVARVSSAVLTNIIAIHIEDGDSTTHTHLNANTALSISPAADSGGWNSTNLEYVYTFLGTKHVRFTAAPEITIGGQNLAFDKFVIGSKEYTESPIDLVTSFGVGSGSTPGKEMAMVYTVAGNRTVNLDYGVVGEHTCDVTMGTFSIVETSDQSGEISTDGKSATVQRGKTIRIVVTPANGYKFDGWYTSRIKGGDPLNAEIDWTMTVTTNRTLYAMFSQDANMVCVWEGGDTNKSFEWRSKTYVSSRPFNPTCCRVDTEGYPLIELDVDMFSAPDSSPTATTTLTNVSSQTARRLPVRRSEKYMQICVKNSREVDSVTVATAMGELAV